MIDVDVLHQKVFRTNRTYGAVQAYHPDLSEISHGYCIYGHRCSHHAGIELNRDHHAFGCDLVAVHLLPEGRCGEDADKGKRSNKGWDILPHDENSTPKHRLLPANCCKQAITLKFRPPSIKFTSEHLSLERVDVLFPANLQPSRAVLFHDGIDP